MNNEIHGIDSDGTPIVSGECIIGCAETTGGHALAAIYVNDHGDILGATIKGSSGSIDLSLLDLKAVYIAFEKAELKGLIKESF